MSDNIQKIKERLNIVEVISSYIKLEKAGANLKGKCPFHHEKTPSFFVSPDRGSYKCFGCGAGGDIFTFVQQFEGVDFSGSLKILAEKAGVKLVKENYSEQKEKSRLYEIMEDATNFFIQNLKIKPEVIKYLAQRGLKKESFDKFRIGFAKDEWDDLYSFLKNKKYNDKEIEKVGLIKKGEKKYYDRFRNRIIFPLFDNSGRVIAFSGRFFGEDDKQAKYLNSPETEIFHKSNILYGYNFAKNEIRKKDYSILVEGQMDLIMSQQEGFLNTVATSGTALTENHIENLSRLSNKVIMAFDGDDAGLSAANRGAMLALAKEMEVKLAKIPNKSDPADILLEDKKIMIDVLKKSSHIIEFNLDNLIQQEPNKRNLGIKIKKIILPLISEIKSKMEQDYFISLISSKTQIPEKSILEDLKNEKEEGGKAILNKEKNEAEQTTKKEKVTREIMGIIYWQKEIAQPKINVSETEIKLEQILGHKIIHLPTEAINEIIFQSEIFYSENKNLQEKIEELFTALKKEIWQEERFNLMEELKNNPSKEREILEKIQDLSKQIQNIG